jgi:hypothetical protein
MGSLCTWTFRLAALPVLVVLNDVHNLFFVVLLGLKGFRFPVIFRVPPFDIRTARNTSIL